ncbi:MAG: hypothetical protein BWX88_04335 [Planctomycetes bacterium ADurb.Bin126]|nr:MAG: hypothetical protein BWX88_04335 [Planctomycetes bacterium ADurb.Bin126]
MNDLMVLWRKRILAVLGIVRAGEREHREIANMAAQVGADYHGRFIVELLQNASDQACEVGLTDSTVTIIRSPQLVAVANEGAPFTDDGLRSITSLGLSTKNPQDAIGNKGIGFKSVFQVSGRPEVYSANAPGVSFLDNPGLMFRMSLTPFEDAQYASLAKSMIEEQIEADGQPRDPKAVEDLFAEISAAAPFKFPLPLSVHDARDRLAELGETPIGQTMVILPLRQSEEVGKTVDTAIDELFQNAGAAILFLPCVSSVRVVDRVRGFDRTIGRRPLSAPRVQDGFGILTAVATYVREDGLLEERVWRMISRKLGTADVVAAEEAAEEARRLNEEAKKLPGSNWDKVGNSPVSVALPLPSPSTEQTILLGANGRVCIGLPTKDATGTPAWINAHFYGTISRTGIDLIENSYNAMLFQEAIRLHEALITDLKTDSDVSVRRAATLAFEKDKGPLAEALHAPDGQASGDIILAADGEAYQSPRKTVLPHADDLDALLLMVPRPCDAAVFGFALPETELARSAKPLIETLMGEPADAAAIADLFLARRDAQVSLLEHAAKANRLAGPSFWESFLGWAAKRFSTDQLADQCVLPIGREALAKPSDRVFLPPSAQQTAAVAAEPDGEISELPAEMMRSLRFLDETAVPVRKKDSRDLTDLAAKLAPDTSRGLVRRPRLDDLLNDAVGPLMQQLGPDVDSRQIGGKLLRQAVQWLLRLSDTGRGRLTRDALRVPAPAEDQAWVWVPPSGVYFGPGWTEEPCNSLLQEAYGHEPSRLLISWDAFAAEVGIPDDDRDDWLTALETIGVSRSPKIVQPRSGYRIAPLASRSNSELSIDYAKCPIQQAEPFWKPYLESTRHRSASTSSGQPFDYRPVAWIDGLEREDSRSSVVRLMLLVPNVYEPYITASLERQDIRGKDARTVPSLWAHAIMAGNWPVVPTQRGAVAVSDAWLLDGQQRGLARRRLSLLNQVQPPYDTAERLLPGIGVTTLQTASVTRLFHALHQLGTACAGFDPETRRTALALAEDLFSHLQDAYGRNRPNLPDLKPLCLPLERSGQAVGVPGGQITTAYINDDPVRARFVAGFKDALVWPLQVRHAYRDLVIAIRAQLGDSSVVFTSLAQVESRFTEDAGTKRIPLLEWLASTFPQDSVASDLACLIAYTGRRDTDPNGEDFKKTWQAFENAVLVFGSFPPDSPTPYFYDRTTQLLQVGNIGNAEKVEATWALVGLSYRDTWAAYARELDKGTPGKFLSDRQISSAQRENVENAIGLSSTERFKRIRAAVLMLWLLRFGKQPLDLFEEEWNVHARSVKGLCDWLSCPSLAAAFAASLGATEEDAALAILQAAGLESRQWQEAREALGLAPWRFSHKAKAWRDAGNEIVAVLKTCAARSVSVSPADVEQILRDGRFCNAPDEVACRSEGSDEVLGAVLRLADSVLNEAGASTGVELLRRRLTTITDQARSGLDKVNLDDAPIRDVRVYRDEDEGKRGRDARARLQGMTTVAVALGKALGEEVDPDKIGSDARVSLLLDGWWANCFSIMPAIQRVLQDAAPKTAKRMSDERVFRDPAPANEMLARFPEISAAVSPPVPPAPKRIVTVLGQSRAEDDLEEELLRGTSGAIGQALKALAQKQALDTEIGKLARAAVTAPDSSHRRSGGGAGGGGGAGNKKDKELAGLLGEAFVYEQFRLTLPGFDERSWRSCNRNLYGLEGEGDDSLGCDFSYRDVDGRLTTDPNRPMCYMDVKASSGDGSEPFQMSANEWNKARECHESSDSVYAVIRVAHVREAPTVVDIIFDPFGLYRKGQLALTAQDMWVHVGAPVASHDRESLAS